MFAFVTGATRAMTENTGNSVELIRCAIARLADQENDTKDFLKSGVQAIPVTNEVLDKLVWMVGQDVHDIMCHHPGYGLNRRVESLQRALETYKRCHKDLMEKLDEFDVASQDATLFGRPRANELKEYEIACRKEIFALSSAAAALVSMARHVKENVVIPSYNETLVSNFDSAQHEFIKELRNNLNHVTFHDSNWAIRNSGQERTSHFEFNRVKLIRDGDFNEKAQQYITAQQETIDIRCLFESYFARVDSFYAWLMSEIEERLHLEVKDFRRCLKNIHANSVKCWYRLLFKQMVGPETDLFGHLDKYLTPNELEEVYALPHCSKAQIDRIIEMVDEFDACDDELRALIYSAFGVQIDSTLVQDS